MSRDLHGIRSFRNSAEFLASFARDMHFRDKVYRA